MDLLMNFLKLFYFFILMLLACSCATTINPKPTTLPDSKVFKSKRAKTQEFATPEMVRRFSSEVSNIYLVGPGDTLNLFVWNRPKISDPKIVAGANGKINIPRIGFVNVIGRPVDDIQREITERLLVFYENPEVTLNIIEQRNHRAFILGRVANPGEVQLPVGADLLKVLSLAGGLPVLDKRKAPLTECIITRSNKRIRINLRKLLDEGDMALNAKIQNDDVIFIPESGESEHIFLLGEITQPGIVRLTVGMTFFDALMMAGGPTASADLKKTFLIRMKGEQGIQQINLKEMLEKLNADQDFLLQNSDVIFVARSNLSRFKEFFDYVASIMSGVDMSMSIAEKVGLMQELRRTWWGQQGFVNSQ